MNAGLSVVEFVNGAGGSNVLIAMETMPAASEDMQVCVDAHFAKFPENLLSSTNGSVAAVANMCGYGSAVFLQKLFRRNLGVTPSAWRLRSRSLLATAATNPAGAIMV